MVSAPTSTPNESSNKVVTTKEGIITTIYIAPSGGPAPMVSIKEATLITNVGIDGDRYATNIRKGTYSGIFMKEPGRQLTLVSEDAIMAKLKELPSNSQSSFTMDQLRRNIVVKGLTANDINNMVGYEVMLGNSCRLFVHRRNIPCKYRQADIATCSKFRNTFWDDCGICCEIIEGGNIYIGDKLTISPQSVYQPNRCNVGLKPKYFFKKPSTLSLKEVKANIIPIPIAIMLCLWDPVGFEQVENGYNSVGQYFWSPRAYKTGMFVKNYIRTPLFISIGVGVMSVITIQVINYNK